MLPTPKIHSFNHEEYKLKFTMENVNVSIANALRRTMIADIPTVVIRTELYEQNQCQIEVNTTRHTNEIIKHRLSCIPIHMNFDEHDVLPGNYVLEVDVKNELPETTYVTTEDFRIKHKQTGQYLSKQETHRIFPPCQRTNCYIDFVRLLPKISETIPPAQIKLIADFSIATAKESPVFSVVSTSTYSNTLDAAAAEAAWRTIEERYKKEDMKESEIKFHRKNFYLLDAQRYFVPNSFDFTVESVGVYDNLDIVYHACGVIKSRLQERIDQLDTGTGIIIKKSETTMQNSFDAVFKNEDYTIGKIIEYILHATHLSSETAATELTMLFCGFKKFHPHDTDSTIRVAYNIPVSADTVRGHIRAAAVEGIALYDKISSLFRTDKNAMSSASAAAPKSSSA